MRAFAKEVQREQVITKIWAKMTVSLRNNKSIDEFLKYKLILNEILETPPNLLS